jgi:NADP-dependent 3-hydroxy acid dehydrogenase YdfG
VDRVAVVTGAPAGSGWPPPAGSPGTASTSSAAPAAATGCTASKHALRAVSGTLRLELVGEPIRVTEVAPGMVETDFSLVRFHGDADRAEAVYRGMQPLTADDIADCIAWAVTCLPHVDVDRIVVRPVAQATATVVARQEHP